jgi:hypothetical protein
MKKTELEKMRAERLHELFTKTMRTSPPPRRVLAKIIEDSFDRMLADPNTSEKDRAAIRDYKFQFEACILPIVDHFQLNFTDDKVDSDNWLAVLMAGCTFAGRLMARLDTSK